LHLREERASGTAPAGGFVPGLNTRILNTVKTNTIGATLSSNAVTLLPGTYRCQIRATYGNLGTGTPTTQAFLYNTTDSTYTLVGSSEFYQNNSSSSASYVRGQFTINASKTFAVYFYTSAGLNGGNAASSGQVEVYTEAEFWKIA
jgi:hypothetical protein